ncbi:hypothetical protein [Pseudochrobactrum sp. HB0163]|uniref:hypothetical protein n=1 Tax=Pseudochrobactrum sp. HB0163 TaxID=3450708 RepID=UPI003F6E02C2
MWRHLPFGNPEINAGIMIAPDMGMIKYTENRNSLARLVGGLCLEQNLRKISGEKIVILRAYIIGICIARALFIAIIAHSSPVLCWDFGKILAKYYV